MTANNDWQGLPVEDKDDEPVWAWEIEPSMQSGCDTTVIRGWQDMMNFVESKMDCWLEDYTEDELADGVSLTFRLVKYRPSELARMEDCDE